MHLSPQGLVQETMMPVATSRHTFEGQWKAEHFETGVIALARSTSCFFQWTDSRDGLTRRWFVRK